MSLMIVDCPVEKNPEELIPTRKSLLSRLKNWDDQTSWMEFFNAYWKLIYGVALRSGLTDADAQEVVQETVILVAKKMQEFKYDPAGSFKAWLLHTTRWRINDQLRKKQRASARMVVRGNAETGTSDIDNIPDPMAFRWEEIWDEEWEKNIFDAAIEKVKKQVSAKQYQIFDLYVIKQWPVRQVARTLGISIGRIYLAKHRITGLIRREVESLKRRGFDGGS